LRFAVAPLLLLASARPPAQGSIEEARMTFIVVERIFAPCAAWIEEGTA